MGDKDKVVLVDKNFASSQNVYSDSEAEIVWGLFWDCLKRRQYSICGELLDRFKPRKAPNIAMKNILTADLLIKRNMIKEAKRVLEGISLSEGKNLFDKRLLGYFYFVKGKLYSKLSQRTRAIEAYNRALSIFDKALKQSNRRDLPIWTFRGELLIELGDELGKFGNYSQALKAYLEAMYSFNEAIKLTRGRDIMPWFEKGIALLNAAKSLYYLGDYEASIDMLLDSIRLFERVLRKTNMKHVEAWWYRGIALRRLGLVFIVTSDYPRAFYAFSDALDSFLRIFDETDKKQNILYQLFLIASHLAELSFELNAFDMELKFNLLATKIIDFIIENQTHADQNLILRKIELMMGIIFSLIDMKRRDLADRAICAMYRWMKHLIDKKKIPRDKIKDQMRILKNTIKKRKIRCQR